MRRPTYLFTHGTRNEARKQTEIGEIPESWEVVKLKELFQIRYGLGQPPELDDDDGIPIIRATDIKKGRIICKSVMKVKREAIPEKRNPFLKKGDILVVRSGAYTGDLAMYEGQWEIAIAGYDLVASPYNQEIEPKFFADLLLSQRIQTYFGNLRHRSAQPHLNADQVKNTTVVKPSLPEQKEIADILKSCDTKIQALEKEISLTDELFHATLEELMTGKLSTKNLIEQ